MSIVYFLFKTLFLLLPKSVGIYLYQLEFKIVRYFLKNKYSAHIHYRNSLALGYVSPPDSDIDLTIICSRELFTKINQSVDRFRSLFPNLGEIHFYDREEDDLNKMVMNIFEKKRDPYFDLQLDEDDLTAQKMVFLIKMISHADFANREKFRLKKWKSYLQLVDENTAVNSYDEVEQLLKNIIPQEIGSKLDKTLHQQTFNIFFHFSQWLTLSKQFHTLSDDSAALETLSTLEKKILQYIIFWEIWGVSGQPFLSADHLSTCRTFLKFCLDTGSESQLFRINNKLDKMSLFYGKIQGA